MQPVLAALRSLLAVKPSMPPANSRGPRIHIRRRFVVGKLARDIGKQE
jgi:hypothetical protein